MIVFVLNKHGEALMPCSQRKARLLLKQKKAKIVSYKPFAIQLLYGSYGYKQEIEVIFLLTEITVNETFYNL